MMKILLRHSPRTLDPLAAARNVASPPWNRVREVERGETINYRESPGSGARISLIQIVHLHRVSGGSRLRLPTEPCVRVRTRLVMIDVSIC